MPSLSSCFLSVLVRCSMSLDSCASIHTVHDVLPLADIWSLFIVTLLTTRQKQLLVSSFLADSSPPRHPKSHFRNASSQIYQKLPSVKIQMMCNYTSVHLWRTLTAVTRWHSVPPGDKFPPPVDEQTITLLTRRNTASLWMFCFCSTLISCNEHSQI